MNQMVNEPLEQGVLRHKGYVWNLAIYHKWADRTHPKVQPFELINRESKVFSMGSCFADNVVRFLSKETGIHATSFSESRFYDTLSILQTIKHLLIEPQYDKDDIWVTENGLFAHPFRNPRFRAKTYEELKSWSDLIESEAKNRLLKADVIIITLGGTEAWRHPKTKKAYITLPFPDIFNKQMPGIAEFHNYTFEENYLALEEIYRTLRQQVPHAHLIFTVSPIRMTFTMSNKDVTRATCQAKSTLRAAVGELADKYSDHLHYFHSYEMIEYAPPGVNFFLPDNVHVNDTAIAMVMHEFAKYFLSKDLQSRLGFELVERLLQNNAPMTDITAIQKFDAKLFVIKILRTLGLEKSALLFYKRLKAS